MLTNTYFDNLRKRFNYDDKTIKALSLIMPKIISYYGSDYKDIILNAVLNCEIIPCASEDTINIVLNRLERENRSFTNDLDLKKGESVYSSCVCLKYNEGKNIYEVDNIDRVIVTSHTYNFDSLKGLETLTHALCHLIKSYNEEFTIDENTLIVKNGISYERYKIIYDKKNISLDLIESYGKGLEEGFTIYDTEKIVSLIYNTNYKCYDYDSVYKVAKVLKEKYNLKDEINSFELKEGALDFFKKYGDDISLNLGRICDEAVELENEMLLAYTREDKDVLSDILNQKLNNDAYDNLINIYLNKAKKRTT